MDLYKQIDVGGEERMFKVGDAVRIKYFYGATTEYDDFINENGNQHIITGIECDCNYILDNDDRFDFKESELEFINENEVKTEFKVGDYVSSKYFEGVKQIHAIAIEKTKICNIAIGDTLYNPAVLTLVCGFTKGQKIYVSDNHEDCREKLEYEFYAYDLGLDCPFIVKANGTCGTGLPSFKYAKAIEPEYKPYKLPELKWIGREVKDKTSGKKLRIENITRNKITNELVLALLQVSSDDLFYFTLQELYDNCTWLDNSPCGDLL